MVFNATFNNI